MAQVVRINNLRGGLVTDVASYLLEPNEFRVLNNLFISSVERQATLRLRTGNRTLFTTTPTSVNGLTRYRNATLARLVYGLGSAILARDESNGNTATIGVGSGLVGGSNEFAQMLGYLFWVDGKAAVQMWSGSGASGVVGITPVNRAVIRDSGDFALLPGGNLDCYNKPPYRYVVTGVTAEGIESNPSPEGVNTGQFGGRDVELQDVPVFSDPRVVTKNLYRIGGLLTVYTLVDSIDNADTLYTDSTADIDLGTIQLSYSNDQPMGGAEDIIVWKNRLVLSKGFTLLVSNIGQPWYFPEVITNPDTDGRIFDVDPSYENPIVALSNSGSALIILCAKSIHYLMGDTTDSFSLVKVADIGCVSRRCAVQCGQITMWLAPDKMVYGMTAEGVVPMGGDIEKTLKTIPSDTLSSACACHFRQQYHLCVPQTSGVPLSDTSYRQPFYFVYDFRYGKWVDLSRRYMAANLLYAETGVSDTDEVLMTTHYPYYDTSGTLLDGVVAAFGSIPTQLEFDAHFGDFTPDTPFMKRRIAGIRIRGKFSGENGSAIIHTEQVTGGLNLVTTTKTRAYPLVSGEGVIFSRDMDPSLIGTRISLQIKGYTTTMEIDDVWATLADAGQEAN